MLTNESITFGKYKGRTLSYVLKQRKYCAWLLSQQWFRESYEYLYNRIERYEPRSYFLKSPPDESKDFMSTYEFFNLRETDDISLPLTLTEKKCYQYYLLMIEELKGKIYERFENEEENPFNIKAPTKWLKRFESKHGIPRIEFKEFLSSYDLPNIPYIVERIKKEGGVEYKGAKSFIIAKGRSLDQEKWWEVVLKERYGESITVQHTYKKCIFDFLNIDTQTIFECKLGLKDFCNEQHKKYKLALEKYRIIYLISKDCVIDMQQRKLFSSDPLKYKDYLCGIPSLKKASYLDSLMLNESFIVEEVSDISSLFGTKESTK